MEKMRINPEMHLVTRHLVSFVPAGTGDLSVPNTPPLNHTDDCVVMTTFYICVRGSQNNTTFEGSVSDPRVILCDQSWRIYLECLGNLL